MWAGVAVKTAKKIYVSTVIIQAKQKLRGKIMAKWQIFPEIFSRIFFYRRCKQKNVKRGAKIQA